MKTDWSKDVCVEFEWSNLIIFEKEDARMNNVERFYQIVNFHKPDRCLRWYALGFWAETLRRWQKENILFNPEDPFDYFDLDRFIILPGNTGGTVNPYTPQFDESILREDARTVTIRGKDGIVCKRLKNGTSMQQMISFPVQSHTDWEHMKERLDSNEHDFGANYAKQISKYRNNEDPNYLLLTGLYGFSRNLMGMERLAYAYTDMPDMLEDMAMCWLHFNKKVGARIIADMRVDFILYWEDMAYKTGPLIAPDAFRTFMTPYYRELIDFFKSLGILWHMVDTDGNCDVLLPLFSDVGINMMQPFEQAAGNDMIKIRKQYPNMVLWGGIDKRVLHKTKEDIRKEVEEKVPVLWETGGYFPSLDHTVQPCPLENFEYYLSCVAKMVDV